MPDPGRRNCLVRYLYGLCAALAAVCVIPTAASAGPVITGARVCPAPGAAPIENAAVLIRDDRIVSVGPAKDADAD